MARPLSDPDDDEDALRWAGDEERGQERPSRPAATDRDDADHDDDADAAEPDETDTVAPGGRGRSVAAGVFAVPYLAGIVGWVVGTAQLTSGAGNLWSEVLWQFGEFLAIVSPALWFVAVLNLTRTSRPLVRAGWLALGVGVLMPWPALLWMTGALS